MHRIYLHPLPVRIWHWINAAAFVLLILTGLQLRYVGLINAVPFRIAVATHNLVGFVLIADFFLWLGFYLSSDRIKVYHPELDLMKYFRGSVAQALYYGYGIFKRAPEPFHVSVYSKFNPLQAMTYQLIMLLLLPIQIFTGVLLWDLERFARVVALFGGVRVIDTVHVLIFIFFVFYLPAHIYLATLGRRPMTHITEMITGYEEDEEAEGADAAE
ncbi:MAG: cytochrome b/b6 domain-containing protein [Acetobacteraceae bacterium]|jgi:thiosulfate reductase cytochrome b subunit